MQGQSDFRLPLAAELPLSRPRWAGPLSAAECNAARANGVALAYDPAQGGWVLAEAADGPDDPMLPEWARLAQFRLRAWAPDDLPAYHALLDDPDLWRFMPEAMPHPFGLDTARDLIAISGAAPHHLVQCIEAAAGPVGQVRLLWSAPGLDRDEAEVSYWLGRSYRGRGLAAQAVRQAVADAFALRAGLRRVVAFVHPDNAASMRVLERAGFARGGARDSDGWQVFATIRG